ncbi:hypothetical protein EDB84DRAFT_1571489, partial [Lactarius hengduanensis]
MSDPSVAVAEGLQTVLPATVSALRAYEQGTRARLSRPMTIPCPPARARRCAPRFQCEQGTGPVLVAEVDKWKSEANKAIVVNTHQAELINQLRQEAQQWKDQCLRLEETLRGEIKPWKDQFLRVRVPRTPSPFDIAYHGPPQQNTLVPQDDSTPKCVPAPLPGDSSATSSATKRRVSASASSSTAHVDNKPAPIKAMLPRVVRRVQAFIEVPVKEEEQEDLEPERPGSALLLQPPSTSRAGVGRR